MIRIRVGSSWRHDPAATTALRRAAGRGAWRATRDLVDVLAFEVDGVDIAAGRTEGALLPSLEALLRGVASLVAGEPQASVPFRDGSVELVLRRRGASALLTVVALDRPARLLARDVEVELEALAAAALRASAELVREIALALPASARTDPAPLLRRAERRLRAAAPGGPRRGRPAPPPVASAPAAGPVACTFVLADDEDLVGGYRGERRADLASLLAPGWVRIATPSGDPVASLEGPPFLILRDLAAAAEGITRAARAREPRFGAELAAPVRIPLEVDLAGGSIAVGRGGPVPCPPLDLAGALLEAAAAFAREVVARNPRQARNAHLSELARAARDGLAHLAELGGDLQAQALPARSAAPRRPPRRPLGPGRIRRMTFRRTLEADVGAPAGQALWRAGRGFLAAGHGAVLALDPSAGEVLWRAEGCEAAALVGGVLLVQRGGTLECLAAAGGELRFGLPLPPGGLGDAVGVAGGPLVVMGGGAATALDPVSGRTRWTFEPPAAARVHAAALGSALLVGADTGILYGLDPSGALAFRLRVPGPVLAPPRPWGRLALVLVGADPGASLLAIDPSTGSRRWEAPLDLSPSGAWVALGGRAVVAGMLGGDPMVTAVGPAGRPAFTVAPALGGPVAVAASGRLVLLQDGTGAVQALGLDGSTRWSFAREPGHPPPGPLAPVVARGTVIAAGDGLHALDLACGAPLGRAPGVAPVRLCVDGELSAVLIEADGAVVGLRLATHLSVL
jgi:outer membrane protein assembly factor BamB